MFKMIHCCVAGVNGYVGQVLIQLINTHPNLKLSAILGKELNSVSVHAAHGVPVYTLPQIPKQANSIDVLLLATPAEVSIELVQALSDIDLTIIDLSGAFRLSVDKLQQWYGLSHQLNQYFGGAPYGLFPYVPTQLGHTKLVANPGCYATGALLALIPLLQNNIIDSDSIVIDAKSGVSGAGKKANPELLYGEISGNFMPYKVGKHQHLPEIKKCLFELTGKDCEITLVTQLLPIKSGIAMSVYCQANQKWIKDKLIAQVISEVFNQVYGSYPLLRFGQLNQGEGCQDKFLLSLSNVVGTPKTHISFYIDKGNICLFVFFDNLWKGAASQAIENINMLYQLPADTGLSLYKGGV